MTDTHSREEEQDQLWPDALEVGDRITIADCKYEVTGTGPAEASIERTDDSNVTGELFRWAFSNAVGVEIEQSYEQDEFGEMVSKRVDHAE